MEVLGGVVGRFHREHGGIDGRVDNGNIHGRSSVVLPRTEDSMKFLRGDQKGNLQLEDLFTFVQKQSRLKPLPSFDHGMYAAKVYEAY